jgi:hypothetical protein
MTTDRCRKSLEASEAISIVATSGWRPLQVMPVLTDGQWSRKLPPTVEGTRQSVACWKPQARQQTGLPTESLRYRFEFHLRCTQHDEWSTVELLERTRQIAFPEEPQEENATTASDMGIQRSSKKCSCSAIGTWGRMPAAAECRMDVGTVQLRVVAAFIMAVGKCRRTAQVLEHSAVASRTQRAVGGQHVAVCMQGARSSTAARQRTECLTKDQHLTA